MDRVDRVNRAGEPGDVAALVDVVLAEPEAWDQLRSAVSRLDATRRARAALAQCSPDVLRSALQWRAEGGVS